MLTFYNFTRLGTKKAHTQSTPFLCFGKAMGHSLKGRGHRDINRTECFSCETYLHKPINILASISITNRRHNFMVNHMFILILDIIYEAQKDLGTACLYIRCMYDANQRTRILESWVYFACQSFSCFG